jgi:hypothetical protein
MIDPKAITMPLPSIPARRLAWTAIAAVAFSACATTQHADDEDEGEHPARAGEERRSPVPSREAELRALIADPGNDAQPLERSKIRARALGELSQILYDRGQREEALQTVERAMGDARAADDEELLRGLHTQRFRYLRTLALQKADSRDFKAALRMIDSLNVDSDLTREEHAQLSTDRLSILDRRGDERQDAIPNIDSVRPDDPNAPRPARRTRLQDELKVTPELPHLALGEKRLSAAKALPPEPPAVMIEAIEIVATDERKSPEEIRVLYDKEAALANVPRIDGRAPPGRVPRVAPSSEKPRPRAETPATRTPTANERVAASDTPPIGPGAPSTTLKKLEEGAIREGSVQRASVPSPGDPQRTKSGPLALEHAKEQPVVLPMVDGPASETGTFDPRTVQTVVRAQRKSVAACYDRSLRVGERLDGRLEIEISVLPTGGVSLAEVRSPAFQGTELARCVSQTIRRWRFPPFQGDPQRVGVPFVFRAPLP